MAAARRIDYPDSGRSADNLPEQGIAQRESQVNPIRRAIRALGPVLLAIFGVLMLPGIC